MMTSGRNDVLEFGMTRICMHSPSAGGGQPLYVQELLTALAQHPSGGNRFEWVTAEDLQPQFKGDLYAVHAILPSLRPRRQSFRRALPPGRPTASLIIRACDRVFPGLAETTPRHRGGPFPGVQPVATGVVPARSASWARGSFTPSTTFARTPTRRMVPAPALGPAAPARRCKLCDALFVHHGGAALS